MKDVKSQMPGGRLVLGTDEAYVSDVGWCRWQDGSSFALTIFVISIIIIIIILIITGRRCFIRQVTAAYAVSHGRLDQLVAVTQTVLYTSPDMLIV